MTRARRFRLMDGEDVEADSALALFESLRQGETLPPADLSRYLDLIRSRGVLGFGVDLDVGLPGTDIRVRCRRALKSLMRHGWVRVVRNDDIRTGGPVAPRLAAAG